MKIFYFILLVVVMVFFNACATTMTPEQIDSFAIKPNKLSKIFSPPKDGYARLIMYREPDFLGWPWSYSILIKYNPTLKNGKFADIYTKNMDRVLCKMINGASCIVNIKAGNLVALTHRGMENKKNKAVLFTPRNRHIYCINISVVLGWIPQFQFDFRDAATCLAEYKAMYKPKHRDYQKKWFDGLVKKGDKRAYKE